MVEVRNGVEVRLHLENGLFSKKRFYKRGEKWGLSHSIDNSKQILSNKAAAQKLLDWYIDTKPVTILDVKGKQLWPKV